MQAEFRLRESCICCRSNDTRVIAEGGYDDAPLHDFLANDPWGVSPMPALKGARWQLRACNRCAARFQGLILTPEWRLRCFTEWMSETAILEFEHAAGEGFTTRFARAAQWVGHVHSLHAMAARDDGLRVLDFGCGSGEFLAHAALHGAEAHGVDISPARRELANGATIEVVATLEALRQPLKGMFDAITLFEVLEHLDDPRAVLETLRGWIRPGGILVLETPDAGHVDRIATIEDYRAIHPLDHINAFDGRTLAEIARRSGFAPATRQFAFVSDGAVKTFRKEARRVVDRVRKPSTQQYFRAV